MELNIICGYFFKDMDAVILTALDVAVNCYVDILN